MEKFEMDKFEKIEKFLLKSHRKIHMVWFHLGKVKNSIKIATYELHSCGALCVYGGGVRVAKSGIYKV